jgi:hypothetical protein
LDPPARARTSLDGSGRLRTAKRDVTLLATVVVMFLLLTTSLAATAAFVRQQSGPTTRAVLTDWVTRNLPPDSRIAQESSTTYLPSAPGHVLRVFTLADRTLDQYRADGYRYLITTSSMSQRFEDPTRYPRENAFYRALAASGHLVASFEPGPDRYGGVIGVYDLGSAGG